MTMNWNFTPQPIQRPKWLIVCVNQQQAAFIREAFNLEERDHEIMYIGPFTGLAGHRFERVIVMRDAVMSIPLHTRDEFLPFLDTKLIPGSSPPRAILL